MHARKRPDDAKRQTPLAASPAMASSRTWLATILLGAVLALTLALASRAEAYVYWTNSEGENSPDDSFATIGRANLDGTSSDHSFIAADFAIGLAVDRERVYWANRADDTIARASLDGTAAEPGFITDTSPGPSFPTGVAVDSAHLYWANYGGTTIGRANLDATGVDPSFITGASLPSAVAVDSEHVYWANRLSNTIGRANLDGTGANQSFITGASFPTGVAVDDQHVYWTSFGFSGGVGRANLDGTGVDQSFIPAASFPIGVAVDDAHVYWANRNGNSIGRANLDGTGVDQSFITARGPRGVAVDALRSFSFGKVKRNKRKGTARLTVEVPSRGVLVLAKTTVNGKRKQVGAAGSVKLPIEPRGKTRVRLKRKGKAKVEATVTYTPDGSDPNSVANTDTKTLKLVRRR